MGPWLIGKALSPFFALLLIWLVARPISRAVLPRMREGRMKRLLSLDSEREPWKYGLIGFCVYAGMIAVIALLASG